jgi:hypothetical protein
MHCLLCLRDTRALKYLRGVRATPASMTNGSGPAGAHARVPEATGRHPAWHRALWLTMIGMVIGPSMAAGPAEPQAKPTAKAAGSQRPAPVAASAATPPAQAQAPLTRATGTPTYGPGRALRDTLQRAGVVACGARSEQVGDFLLGEGVAGAFLFLPDTWPDRRMTGVALEIASPAGVAFASLDLAPEPDGCGASYEAIRYWPQPCAAVARSDFEQIKPVGLLKQHIMALELSKLGRVFLMPAGTGCVSIKRELLP